MPPHNRATVFSLLCIVATTAVAVPVYRWVDEQGKVHYSDVVPERYRTSAKPITAPSTEPTAAQQQEAVERASRDKAKALALSSRGRAASAPYTPAGAESQPVSKRPAQVPNDQTDCETWQRLYMESIECFGPYRTVRGGTKPDAFNYCNVVPEPPPTRCRMRIP